MPTWRQGTGEGEGEGEHFYIYHKYSNEVKKNMNEKPKGGTGHLAMQ